MFKKSALAIFFLIFLDQLAKHIIRSSGGFYVCNPNIAFSIKLPQTLLMLFWIVIVIFVGFVIFNFKFFPLKRDHAKAVAIFNKFSNFQIFGLSLIFSGGISNLIDRLRFGCVIDFIDLNFWPVFNLADVFITAGVILLIYKTFTTKH